MKEYMVYARRTRGCFGSGDATYGPFRSRNEADATMRNLSALGKYAEVTVKTQTTEDEDEDKN